MFARALNEQCSTEGFPRPRKSVTHLPLTIAAGRVVPDLVA